MSSYQSHVVRGALLPYALLKCLIKQKRLHRTAMWEKLLKSPPHFLAKSRLGQIKLSGLILSSPIGLR